MTQINAKQVKELRDITHVGMMECKKALQETNGDLDGAIQVLRERGMAVAAKKADRAANEGLIDIALEGGIKGSMVEVNCETDFVAKNDDFQRYVKELAGKGLALGDNELAENQKEEHAFKISEVGENLIINRNATYTVEGGGAVASYIHLGGKVGVMIEIGAEKDENKGADALVAVGKDIAMHIAAMNPQSIDRSGVPAELVKSEKALYAKQVEGKPENIIEKILSGKMEKFYSQIVLLEQAFVKDGDQTITDLLTAAGKEIDDTASIRRFARYQIGG